MTDEDVQAGYMSASGSTLKAAGSSGATIDGTDRDIDEPAGGCRYGGMPRG
jgi:hypothetical protein